MANIKNFVVQIRNSETKTEDFIWELETPSRSKITKHEEQHPNVELFQVSNIKFETGLLSKGNNEGEIKLKAGILHYSFNLIQKKGASYSLKNCEIKFYSNEKLLSSHKSSFKSDFHFVYRNHLTSKGKFQDLKSEYWNDEVDRIRLYFTVQRVETGRIITPDKNVNTLDTSNYSPTVWNSTEFFLSPDHSDFTFVCEGEEFPSHKVLLSIGSPVFNRMLKPANGMTEVKDGKVEITDMKPNILKELLRFIYYGWVSNLRDVADLLILPADKYDIPKLKNLCETSLLRQLTPQTALTLYSLADSVQATTLMSRSLECIKTNKSTIFLHSEELVEFTHQYPEVMIQVLKV